MAIGMEVGVDSCEGLCIDGGDPGDVAVGVGTAGQLVEPRMITPPGL